MKTEFGYCCINLSLKPDKVSINRTMRKKTFLDKGLNYVSELILKNLVDLNTIIEWNYKNNIKIYRMSSDMFPWMSEYEIINLPNIKKITQLLKKAGKNSKKYNQRLSFHPGPFNVLGSPNPDLVEKTKKELNQHAEIMDIMGLEQSIYYPINIHCNGVYGDKIGTLKRWSDNYLTLSESAKNRLVIENDDKENMYSVKELYDGIFKKVNVPITFDYYHHTFNSNGLNEKEAFMLAYSTWDYHKIKPLFHYSSSRKLFENIESKQNAHADYIYQKINDYGFPVDIDIESKMKDISLLNYLNDYCK